MKPFFSYIYPIFLFPLSPHFCLSLSVHVHLCPHVFYLSGMSLGYLCCVFVRSSAFAHTYLSILGSIMEALWCAGVFFLVFLFLVSVFLHLVGFVCLCSYLLFVLLYFDMLVVMPLICLCTSLGFHKCVRTW